MPDRRYMRNYARNLRGPGDAENANVDASATPQIWRADVPEHNNGVRLTTLFVTVAGPSAGSMEDYGSLPGLANGLLIGVFDAGDDSMLFDLLDGSAIHSNGGWMSFGFESAGGVEGQGGNANTYVFVSYDFEHLGGLSLARSTYLGVVLRDNFAGLNHHYFTVVGTGGRGAY